VDHESVAILEPVPHVTRVRPRRHGLERLEDRVTPTVLFAPQFGVETLKTDGGQRVNAPSVCRPARMEPTCPSGR